MRKKAILLVPVLLVLTALGVWQFNTVKEELILKRAMAMDANGDGVLSRDEAVAIADSTFRKIDADNNGQLEKKELRTAASAIIEHRKPLAVNTPALNEVNPSVDALAGYIQETARLGDLSGIVVLAARNEQLLFREEIGTLGIDSVIPIASASKWLTSAVLLALVDDGMMILDEPLATYLPVLRTSKNSLMTLRHALNHTSGLGVNHILRQPVNMSLHESAKQTSQQDPETPAGTVFRYTGSAMQIAAAAAEAVTGKPWAQLFAEKIANPLAMKGTVYGHPLRPPAISNGRDIVIGGGVYGTAADYMKFLEMIAGGGRYQGKTILSQKAIQEMTTNYIADLKVDQLPDVASDEWGYGLGVWCEAFEENGSWSAVNSGGAFGAFPWVDKKHNIYGLVFVKDMMPRLLPRHLKTRQLINKVFQGAIN